MKLKIAKIIENNLKQILKDEDLVALKLNRTCEKIAVEIEQLPYTMRQQKLERRTRFGMDLPNINGEHK